MPRKQLIRSSEHVYHITSRSNSKEWFYLPIHIVWEISIELLNIGSQRFEIEIHAFVLMNNHYHLMAKFPRPESSIDKFMHFFNRQLALRINMSTGRINHVFGRPYNWSLIDNQNYYHNAIKYLYQNPVRAKLCQSVETYTYSTIKAELELHASPIQLHSYLQKGSITWLNQVYSKDDSKRIQKGFRKRYFRPSYHPSSRKQTPIV